MDHSLHRTLPPLRSTDDYRAVYYGAPTLEKVICNPLGIHACAQGRAHRRAVVQSPATGRSWSAPGGSGQTAPLDRWQDTTGNNQWCKLADGGGSYHRLVNARNETWCADVDSGSMTVGARVIPWPAGTNTNQEWQIVGL